MWWRLEAGWENGVLEHKNGNDDDDDDMVLVVRAILRRRPSRGAEMIVSMLC